MKNQDRLYFAKTSSGQVVGVAEVERGLACSCSCLTCGGRLVAKQGPKVAWHFAHDQPTDQLSCGETALHLAAKATLHEISALCVPSASWELPSLSDSVGRLVPVRPHGANQEVAVHKTELEVSRQSSRGRVQFDALLTTSMGTLGVEILVTHAVDEVKHDKLNDLGLPVVELDLSAYVASSMTFDELKELLRSKAPRTLVAGAAVLFRGAEEKATRDAEDRIAAMEAALADVTQMSLRERDLEVSMARNAGVDLTAPPKCLGSLRWYLAGSHSALSPTRLFGGIHHLLWQLAAIAWLKARRGGAKFSLTSFLEGIGGILGITSHEAFDSRSVDALKEWLGELDLHGYQLQYLYNDDHGWGDVWYQWHKVDGVHDTGSQKDDRQMTLW